MGEVGPRKGRQFAVSLVCGSGTPLRELQSAQGEQGEHIVRSERKCPLQLRCGIELLLFQEIKMGQS